MSIPRHLAVAAAAATLSSCGLFGGDEDYDTDAGYDTANPYGVPSQDGYQSAPYQEVNAPADNPTYGNAAYEETTPVAPSTPAAPPAAPQPIASTHTVVKGDTLWGLSRKYGVSVDALRAANNMAANDNNVRLGSTLNIPAR